MSEELRDVIINMIECYEVGHGEGRTPPPLQSEGSLR
jgi:hypothetical protein